MRRAQRFAETALDAAVDDVLGSRHRLQVLEVGGGIVVEDDAGVEEEIGVEQALDGAHQVGRFLAPFHFDERCHVAAGAVFGLERTIVLVHHQIADVVHESGVAVDLGLIPEILREHKMQVAFQRMAENDRLMVTVLAEQGLQVQRGIGQRGDRKGNILDDHRRAGPAHGADRREGTLAHLPVHLAGRRVGRELQWLDGNDAGHCRVDGGNVPVQAVDRGRAHFDEKRGSVCP